RHGCRPRVRPAVGVPLARREPCLPSARPGRAAHWEVDTVDVAGRTWRVRGRAETRPREQERARAETDEVAKAVEECARAAKHAAPSLATAADTAIDAALNAMADRLLTQIGRAHV